MIFVTVGTQLPFDRLVRAMDEWAARHHRNDVFAQIGPANAYRPRHVQWSNFIPAPEFRRWMERADLVVSHAGMGTIISALELGAPILLIQSLIRHDTMFGSKFSTFAKRLPSRIRYSSR